MFWLRNKKIIFLGKHKNFEPKIVNIFLPVSFIICFGCSKEPSHRVLSYVLGAQKNRLIETVLLSTRNI